MSVLSSQLLPGARGRRRRGKDACRRSGSALIAAIARREKVAPKAKPRGDIRAVCAEHAAPILGFSSTWQLVNFVSILAHQHGRPRKNVRLPDWKVPEFATAVIAKPCRCDAAGACRQCDSAGYYFVFHLRRSRTKCDHAAPAVPLVSEKRQP